MHFVKGRFCQPRVTRIIAQEMNIAESQVRGLEPGSSLLPHRRVTEDDRLYLQKLEAADEERCTRSKI